MQTIMLSNTGSIIFYISIILIAVIFMKQASYCGRYHRLYLFFAFFVIALPQMIRFNVGIDYVHYYRVAKAIADFDNVFKAINYRPNLEASFSIIMYYSAKILGSVQFGFAIYAFFTQFFIINGIWMFKDKVNPTITLLIYLCTFYWRTYNLTRQALAVAIVFFALHYLYDRNYKYFIIGVLIATIFHSSAIVSLLCLIVFRRNEKNRLIDKIFSYLVPLIGCFLIEFIMQNITKLSVFSRYAGNYDTIYNNSIINTGTILLTILLMMYVIYRIKNSEESNLLSTAILDKAIFYDYIFTILTFVILYTARIGLYFTIPAELSIASMWGRKKRDFFCFTVYQVFILAYCILKFWSIMNSNGYGQLPFIFTTNW